MQCVTYSYSNRPCAAASLYTATGCQRNCPLQLAVIDMQDCQLAGHGLPACSMLQSVLCYSSPKQTQRNCANSYASPREQQADMKDYLL